MMSPLNQITSVSCRRSVWFGSRTTGSGCCVIRRETHAVGRNPARRICAATRPSKPEMLGQRRRRWTNIKPPLGQRLVLLGQTQRQPMLAHNSASAVRVFWVFFVLRYGTSVHASCLRLLTNSSQRFNRSGSPEGLAHMDASHSQAHCKHVHSTVE